LSANHQKMMVPSGSDTRREFFRERGKTGRGRWIPVSESPFSRAFTYKLLNDGLVDSVAVKLPRSRRIRRLIDGDSLDRFLERLMAEQKAAKQPEKATT
jgi:hypothetical protein